MVLEFEGTERMRDALDGVGLAVGEIVARIDAPARAGARMRRVQDAVEHRIAQIDVARGHVDLGTEHARAVRKLARAHAAEQVEVLLDAAVAERAVGPRLGQGAAGETHLLLRLVVDIGLAGADQVLGPRIELLEIVGGVIEVLAPIEAEPAHVALDGVDIFLRLLGRVGVVVAQVAVAAELLRHAEIEADRLGMADMEIAVRLRRKAGDHAFVPARGQVRANDVADEILAGFPYCSFSDGHAVIFGMARRWRHRARIEQIARPGQVRRFTLPHWRKSNLGPIFTIASLSSLNGPADPAPPFSRGKGRVLAARRIRRMTTERYEERK